MIPLPPNQAVVIPPPPKTLASAPSNQVPRPPVPTPPVPTPPAHVVPAPPNTLASPRVETEHDYITVMTYKQKVGKVYSTNFGEVGHSMDRPVMRKTGVYNDGSATAQTFHVPDVESLANIIRAVQQNDHQVIVIAYVPMTIPAKGQSMGTPYEIVNKKEFLLRTNQKHAKNPRKIAGGKILACRTKEHMTRSSWFMFDYDKNDDMPEALKARVASEPYINLLDEMCDVLHGVDYVSVGSASSRVTLKGVAMSKENRHIYMRATHAEDLPRFAGSLMARAFGTQFGYTTKFRDPNGNVVEDRSGPVASIFDRAVFSEARVCYEGAPLIDKQDPHYIMGDIKINASRVDVVSRGCAVVDTTRYASASKEQQRAARMESGRSGGKFCIVNNDDLTPDMMINVKDIETNEESWISMRQFAAGSVGRYRANNPFKRESQSWSAFLNKVDDDGVPCSPFLFTNEYGKYNYNDLTHYFMDEVETITVTEEVITKPTFDRVPPPPVPSATRVPPPSPLIPEPPAIPAQTVPTPPQPSVPSAEYTANDYATETPAQPAPVPAPPPAPEHDQESINSAPQDYIDALIVKHDLPVPVKSSPGWYDRDKATLPIVQPTQIVTNTGKITVANDVNPEVLTRELIRQNYDAVKFNSFRIENIAMMKSLFDVPDGLSDGAVSHFIAQRLFGQDADLRAVNAVMQDDQLYTWNGKFWKPYDTKTLQGYISRNLEHSAITTLTAAKTRSITDMLVNACRPDEPLEKLPKHYLALNNGLLNWNTGEFEPFNRNYFYTGVADFDYDPTEMGKGLLAKVLIDACNGDAKFMRRLLQLMAYCVCGGDNSLQTIVVVTGVSRSGKSLIGKIVKRLTTSVMPKEIRHLLDNKVVTNLVGKNLFYDDEVTTPNNIDRAGIAGIIKNVTSDSELDLTALYTSSMETVSINVKMLWCCNEMPLLPDPQLALANRIEGIYFERSFADRRTQDTALQSAIDDPKELSAMLNLMLAAYVDLLKSNGYESIRQFNETPSKRIMFAECDASVELHKQIRAQATPLCEFVKTTCTIKKGSSMKMDELIRLSRDWADKENLDFVSRQSNMSLRKSLSEALRTFSIRVRGNVIEGLFVDSFKLATNG